MSHNTVNYDSDSSSSDCSSILAYPRANPMPRQPSLRDPVTNLGAGQLPPDFSRQNLRQFLPAQSERIRKHIRTDSHLYGPIEDSESPKKKICTSSSRSNASTQTASTSTSTSTQTQVDAPSQGLETAAALRHRLEELTQQIKNIVDNLVASETENKTLKTRVGNLQQQLDNANQADYFID